MGGFERAYPSTSKEVLCFSGSASAWSKPARVPNIDLRDLTFGFLLHEQKNSNADMADRMTKTPPTIAANSGVGRLMGEGALMSELFDIRSYDEQMETHI